MDVRTLLGGDYIDVSMLQGRRVTKTIVGGEAKPLESLSGKVKTRWVLKLEGSEKQFPLNTTNTKCIIQMFGPETDDWQGKRITLYAASEPKAETGQAIRIYGSPDLEKDITFTAKIGKKRQTFTLHAVRAAKSAARAERQPGEDE